MLESLREDVRCVFERDPAARTTWEIVTNYPGVHALLIHRLCHRLWRSNLKWLARSASTLARWLTGIEIHPGARIGRRFFIDHGMGVVIGETSEIGDDCTLYHGVTLGGTTWQKGKRHPTLANDVVVGAGAKILGPISIGAGARIGSNAVVVKDVPPGATVVGVPGKVVEQQTTGGQPAEGTAAGQLRFDAYGMGRDLPDPVSAAMGRILDHMEAMERRIEALSERLRQLGAAPEEPPVERRRVGEPAGAPVRGLGSENGPGG